MCVKPLASECCNEYNHSVLKVETVRALRAQDLKSILCMVQNCRQQIFDCLRTPECRKALDCLQQCAPNDQASLSSQLQ